MSALILAFVILGGGGAPVTVTSSVTAKPIPAHTISGSATWYRWRLGQAAAGPLLRRALGAHWRGRIVTVCSRRCIRVRLTDWCLCRYGRRLVDLDYRSFRQLAPLSRGVLSVRVSY